MMHGQLQELIPRLERALQASATLDTHTRAAGLRTLGSALSFTEQYDKAREPLEERLALFRQLGDQLGEASALVTLGMGFSNQGSFARAIDLLQAALAISREKEDKRSVGHVLNIIAGCYIDAGDLERGKPAIEEAVAIHKELGDRGFAASDLGTLADVALAQGDHQQAERHAREALEMVTGVGDERNDLYSVAQLACAAALRGDAHAAGRLWAVAEATENRLGMRMLTVERARYERIVAPLKTIKPSKPVTTTDAMSIWPGQCATSRETERNGLTIDLGRPRSVTSVSQLRKTGTSRRDGHLHLDRAATLTAGRCSPEKQHSGAPTGRGSAPASGDSCKKPGRSSGCRARQHRSFSRHETPGRALSGVGRRFGRSGTGALIGRTQTGRPF